MLPRTRRCRINFPLACHARARTLAASMKAKVIVMPKQSVLDPQGVAVRDAIHHHGMPAAKSVRVGKFIEIELDGTQTEAALHEVCRDLLSNPVIEDYKLSVES
jgi:phosphoribosylformylglycinamidine synthase